MLFIISIMVKIKTNDLFCGMWRLDLFNNDYMYTRGDRDLILES